LKEELLIVGCGGTISCRFKSDALHFDRPQGVVSEYLKRSKLGDPYHFVFTVVANKNSTEITGADREALLGAIDANPCSKVLVLYGTNPESVSQTVEYLKAQTIGGKTVVLVGSEFPFGTYHSDAPARLGMALWILKHSDPGVYTTQ
jgi:L-asparaginase/Glu-tRNA(Gln) amidotransferase subunit D